MNSQEIEIKCANIPYFYGTFPRNTPPKFHKNVKYASFIYNLDNSDGPGTHWQAIVKYGSKYILFDSFGNIGPTEELIKAYGRKNIVYNYKRFQRYGSATCGPWAIKFLYHMHNNYYMKKKRKIDINIYDI